MASSSAAPRVQYAVPSREDFNKLDAQTQHRINEAFDLFDKNKDGFLDYNEFRVTLRALGFELEKSVTWDLHVRHGQRPGDWKKSDCPPVWRVHDRSSFQSMAGNLMAGVDPAEHYRRVFKMFDVNGNGIITPADLRLVVQQCGFELNEDDIIKMIEEFDTNGKGGVDADEFMKVMLKGRSG